MASINVSEKDFEAVRSAALDAHFSGNAKAAASLDKLARKINAALSRDHGTAKACRLMRGAGEPFKWQDAPSVLPQSK